MGRPGALSVEEDMKVLQFVEGTRRRGGVVDVEGLSRLIHCVSMLLKVNGPVIDRNSTGGVHNDAACRG